MTIFIYILNFCIYILNFSKIEGGFDYLHYYLLFGKLSFWVIILVKYINLFKTIICLPFKWVSGGRRGGETILNQIYQRITWKVRIFEKNLPDVQFNVYFS